MPAKKEAKKNTAFFLHPKKIRISLKNKERLKNSLLFFGIFLIGLTMIASLKLYTTPGLKEITNSNILKYHRLYNYDKTYIPTRSSLGGILIGKSIGTDNRVAKNETLFQNKDPMVLVSAEIITPLPGQEIEGSFYFIDPRKPENPSLIQTQIITLSSEQQDTLIFQLPRPAAAWNNYGKYQFIIRMAATDETKSVFFNIYR